METVCSPKRRVDLVLHGTKPMKISLIYNLLISCTRGISYLEADVILFKIEILGNPELYNN
jgi:hypothetical protein